MWAAVLLVEERERESEGAGVREREESQNVKQTDKKSNATKIGVNPP